MEVAKVLAPLLFQKCQDVIKQFIQADSLSNPVEKSRLFEVQLVLEHLRKLDLHTKLEMKELKKSAGKKRHLVAMYPLFCECITTKDERVRALLKEIFRELGKELSLIQ